MVTGIDVGISFSFILTCITFLCCTGQDVSSSTPLVEEGLQCSVQKLQHSQHHHLLSMHTTSNILCKIILTQVIIITHIIIKTKVHVLIENTMTTVILFLSRY